MPTSVANDYKLAGYDRGGDVTYLPADGAPSFSVLLASFTELTVEEVAASGGLFSLGDRKWWLGANQFSGGRQPVQSDVIQEASGTKWAIALEAILDPLGMAWTVHTRRTR